MNFFIRLRLILLSGHFTRRAFDNWLRLSMVRINYHQHTLAPKERAILLRDDVKEYWRSGMRSHWTAHCTGGGSFPLIGPLTRDQALSRLSGLAPHSTVIYIDENLHFIFYKTE